LKLRLSDKQTENRVSVAQSGALTQSEILDRLKTDVKEKKIFFTPMIKADEQVGSTALDMRLGSEFIIFKRTRFPLIDVCEGKKEELAWKIGRFQEKVFVPLGKRLILHPQQLVLGSTLEYVRLPGDLMAEVIGRSSWGRLGLIISAATLVHPGYTGVITLELANEGDTPLALYPGIRIAQLVFFRLTQLEGKNELLFSKYMASVEPSFSRLHEDPDLPAIRKIRKEYHENTE
jgi:dCTP deaminase